MSLFTAPLSKFELEKHPNADSLSIAKVGGWQCVVKTSEFENETLGVYIPLDAIAAADHPLLSFLEGKRVKTCKLRGALSQGVLLPWNKVKEHLVTNVGFSQPSLEKVGVEGKDFAGILKVKRWVDESLKLANGGDAETPHESFHKYTDIENVKNFGNILSIGEPVHISEKLHGTSARFGLVEDKLMIGSRNLQLKVDVERKSIWHHVFEKEKIQEKLLALKSAFNAKDVAIYGEIVGPKIQDLKYGQTEPTLFVYDIVVDHKFLLPQALAGVCQTIGLKSVPELKVGPLTEEDFKMRLGNSVLDDSHIREGIVIKPLEPRWDQALGRVILKVISEDYLMRKGAKDVSDV